MFTHAEGGYIHSYNVGLVRDSIWVHSAKYTKAPESGGIAATLASKAIEIGESFPNLITWGFWATKYPANRATPDLCALLLKAQNGTLNESHLRGTETLHQVTSLLGNDHDQTDEKLALP